MKVLFVISVLQQGRGGHYHSLNHISKEIGSNLDSGIITVGVAKSDVLVNNNFFLGHIEFNGLNILSLRKEFKKVLEDFSPDIIHFFDSNSYNALKLFINNRYRIVVNLCGGPNPIDYPRVENLVLFSQENLNWFKERKKFNEVQMRLIPNRVNKINIQYPLPIKKDEKSFCFLRIARIGNAYIKSFLDAIELVEKLNKTAKNKVKLYIIGTIENQKVFESLLTRIGDNQDVIVITEEKYTLEASKMLYLADAVIATGRGIMEASSLGLPILTPASNTEIPVLVTKENFERFFSTNFSQRNIADDYDIQFNIENINNLISQHIYYQKTSSFSLQLFEGYFDVKNAYNKYQGIYSIASKQNKNINKYRDIYLKLRTLYHFYLNSN